MSTVSFKATKRIAKKVNIDFSKISSGKVCFKATKRVPKIIKVDFFKQETKE